MFQIEVRASACNQLIAADTSFRSKFQSISVGIDRLEQIYVEERQNQREAVQMTRRR
jgi:hypothetical protein